MGNRTSNELVSSAKMRRGSRTNRSRSRSASSSTGGESTAQNTRNLNEVAAPKPPSYWQMIRGGYDELVNAIIRPPRAEYQVHMLGPKMFSLEGTVYEREDFQLENERGMHLACSHWKPKRPPKEPRPCIIYLHGNASCRAEALECLPIILATGLSLVAFDFSGSGLSDGEYISLGFYERDDVKTVMHHLRQSGKASSIGLWGRSMGAVTALMHADRDPSIACLVLDSPFTSLRQLAKELVEHAQLSVPRWAVGVALKFVRSSVKTRAGFDINRLEPIKHTSQCFVPAFFGAAEDDNFIKPHHSQQLHDAYGGSKNLVLFPGDHNSPRPSFFFHSVSIFLQNTMITPFGLGLDKLDQQDQAEPTEGWSDTAAAAGPGYQMPAPLSASGAGLGIAVGVPSADSATGGELAVETDDDFFGMRGGFLSGSAGSEEDVYFDAMLRQAIELSLSESNAAGGQEQQVAAAGQEQQAAASGATTGSSTTAEASPLGPGDVQVQGVGQPKGEE